jgi:hypothetical protein
VHLRQPSEGLRMSGGGGSISQKRRNACSKPRYWGREITPLTVQRATDSSEEMLVAHVRAVAWSLLRAFRATTSRDFRKASREALAGYYRKNLLGVKAGQQTETESENGAR